MFAYRIQGPQKRSLTVQAGIGRMVLYTCIVMGGLTLQPGPASSGEIDLRKAVIVCPPKLSKAEGNAVKLIVEEAQKRTLIQWDVAHVWPADTTPVIAIGPAASLPAFAGSFAQKLVPKKGSDPLKSKGQTPFSDAA